MNFGSRYIGVGLLELEEILQVALGVVYRVGNCSTLFSFSLISRKFSVAVRWKLSYAVDLVAMVSSCVAKRRQRLGEEMYGV